MAIIGAPCTCPDAAPRYTAETDFWTAFGLSRLGMFVVMLPLYPFHRQALGEIVRLGRGRLLGIMALSEVLALAALLFGTIAMSRGPVTLVAALTSVQPFFVLVYALVLTRYFPAVLSEETGPRVLGKKLAAKLGTVCPPSNSHQVTG